MIMGHASAIEAALRLDETISITDEQRRQVANLLAVAGWRPPARVVTTVAELDALSVLPGATGPVLIWVLGVIGASASRWLTARVSGHFPQRAHRPARPAPQRTRATGLTRPQSVVGLDHDSGGEVCGRGVVGILFARHEP